MAACTGACSEASQTPKRRNAEFKITKVFELPVGERITGGDAPSYPPNADYYLTTLSGKVYCYTRGRQAPLELLYQVPNMDTIENKGLYSIAIDRDYAVNNKLYLSYASPLGPNDKREHQIQNPRDPNLYTPIIVDHLTIVQEFRRPVHQLEPSQVLKKLEQFSNESVGNWIGAMAPMFGTYGTGNRLLFATGGNPMEDRLAAMFGSHLSSLRFIIPDRPDLGEEMWSSAIQNPIACSSPNIKISAVRCLVEMHDSHGRYNGTGLYNLKQGYNYGSKDFVDFCDIGLPCRQQFETALNRDAMYIFPLDSDNCPVRWVHVYSGWELKGYYGRTLLVRDSCYSRRLKAMTEVQILYVDYNSGLGQPRTLTPLVLEMDHKYLVDAKLLGADSHNTLLLTGVSLKTGTTVVQQIKPNPNKHWMFR